MSALYRTYRPQLFADVVGQAHIKITLQNELSQDKLAHAYLFCGARGLGKTSVARLLAKAVNCQNRVAGQSEPCNECRMCHDLMDQRSADVIEIDAASNTGVDNVRENIIDTARFSPSIGKYKVFIIDEVHMLSISAFNALLKILEEPPRHVIFILCTTETHKVPETIISRCQRFDFKRVLADQMKERLEWIVKQEKKKLATTVIDDIVRLSDGCLRDAESLLAKVLMLGDDISQEEAQLVLPHTDLTGALDWIEAVHTGNATAGIELINRLLEQGVNLDVFTNELVELVRQILLTKTDPALTAVNQYDETTRGRLVRYAETMSYENIMAMIKQLLEAREQFKNAFIIQLPLELATVKLITPIAVRSEPQAINHPTIQPISKSEPAKQEIPLPPEPANIVIEKEPAPIVAVESINDDESVVESQPSIDLEPIRAKWQELVSILRETNYSLSSLLRLGRPVTVTGNKLEVSVQSSFYKDRLEHASSQEAFKIVSQKLFGLQLVPIGIVDAQAEPLIAMAPAAQNDAVPVTTIDLPPVTAAVASGLTENNNQINIAAPAKAMNPVEDALGLF